jgi:predicted RNA-binding Zn-ribbon protein involved in translation (DUF1610 family)
MANRQEWLRTLAVVIEAGGDTLSAPCPDCGELQLVLRYIVDTESRIGYALFWCNAGFHGISVSRVRAPDEIEAFTLGEPESLEGVPNFTRHE